ncbi:hypothetical protein F5887DRAFT_1080066 [Amanita rubescens]|nr:hypothetical protein F5887DRAFT_1080066 [Amanita rubescens]
MSLAQKNAYNGFERKLVIAFDVGTTFSGVSYAFLIPGETPTIQSVTRFPGQQKVAGDSKIPSIVCYDGDGNVAGVGSEADPEVNPELWEVEELAIAEWFKLHLRPPHLVAEQRFDAKDIPPLPLNKTVIDVFGDLLKYLYKSAMDYIQERQGVKIFESVGANIDFVLSHPNGWEGKQQLDMRRAAIAAGLVKDMPEASKRISFVTEGEASLHFCLNNVPSALNEYANDGVLILDCGGGTVDISAYAQSSNGRFREIAAAECLLQGSIFVTRRAQAYLTEKLRESRYGTPEDITIMAKYFDKTTKPNYKGSSKPHFIRFGRSENDLQFDIRNGNVKINGMQIAEFFEPAVRSIVQAIEEHSRTPKMPIKAIFMVGGFGASDYLFSKLNEHFSQRGINILRPDSHLSKAVAEGAISHILDRSVASRMSRYTYGIECCTPFVSHNPEHVARRHTCLTRSSGNVYVPGVFSAILEKDTAVFEEKEFRSTFHGEYSEEEFHEMSIHETDIKCYRSKKAKAPAWIDQAPGFFPDLCIASADFSELKKSIRPRTNRKNGMRYYDYRFDIILLFGLTELKAQMAWLENGVERRGPASIIHDITSE